MIADKLKFRNTGSAWILAIIFGAAQAGFMTWTCDGLAPEDPEWRWSNPSPHGNNIFNIIEFGGVLVQLCDSGRLYISSDGADWDFVDTGVEVSLRSATVYEGSLLIGTGSGKILRSVDLVEFEEFDLQTGDWVEGMASSVTVAVAVGDSGSIWLSSDGGTWAYRATGFSDWLRGVHHNGRRFVAVGENGTILTSVTGLNWDRAVSPVSENLNRVKGHAGGWLAVGDSGTVIESADGVSWQVVDTGFTSDLFDLVRHENGDVLVGREMILQRENGQSDFIKADTVTWPWLTAIEFGGSLYVCGRTGMVMSREVSGGAEWGLGDQSLRNWIWDLTIVDSEMFAAGDLGTIMTSTRGIRWEALQVPVTATNTLLMGIAGDSKGLVSVGTDGTILFSAPVEQTVLTTNTVDGVESVISEMVTIHGLDWVDVSPANLTMDLQGITVFQERFFTSGESGLLFSSVNGTDWSQHTVGTTEFLSGLSAGDTRIIVCGSGGFLAWSDDGVSWQRVATPVSSWLVRCRHLNDRFFVGGQGGVILVSDDGVSWQQAEVPDSDAWVQDFEYLNGHYYAAGTLGSMWTSLDGMTWTTVPVATGKSLYALQSVGHRLVVAGIEGIILRVLTERLDDPVSVLPPVLLSTETSTSLGVSMFGETDQQITVESSSDLIEWVPVLSDEITDPDGLYFLIRDLSDPSSNGGEAEFYRAVPTTFSSDL